MSEPTYDPNLNNLGDPVPWEMPVEVSVDATPAVDVTECPDCAQTGRYDARVKVGGRGIYICPAGHRWQDANETPSTKGYIAIPGEATS